MNRVEIANSHHRIRLECDATGSAAVKLAMALWHETYVDEPDPHAPDLSTFSDMPRISNWRHARAMYGSTEDADTGE